MKIPDTLQFWMGQEKIPVLRPDWKDRMTYKIKPQKTKSETSMETASSPVAPAKVPCDSPATEKTI